MFFFKDTEIRFAALNALLSHIVSLGASVLIVKSEGSPALISDGEFDSSSHKVIPCQSNRTDF